MLVRNNNRGKGRVVQPCTAIDGDRSNTLGNATGPSASAASAARAAGHAPGAAAAKVQADGGLALVVYASASGWDPQLHPPRWPPSLRTSQDLPSCRPSWADGLARAQQLLACGQAVRLCGVLDVRDVGRAAKSLLGLVRGTSSADYGSGPQVQPWASRADVHRFLCYDSSKREALAGEGGTFGLPFPETRQLPAVAVCEFVSMVERWQDHRLYLQLDAFDIVAEHEAAATAAAAAAVEGRDSSCAFGVRLSGGEAESAGGASRRWVVHSPLPAAASSWLEHGEAAAAAAAAAVAADGGATTTQWYWALQKVLAPTVIKWLTASALGRYWPGPALCGGSKGGCGVPPYRGARVSLDWGSEGALLPLRLEAPHDRVLLQLRGTRRVLLVPPSQALPGLAPFPVIHPYDGYSMPALCSSLVYETPGVDVPRASRLIASEWPAFSAGKVCGMVSELTPGDALFVPACWSLHQELVNEQHNICLVARLIPEPPPAPAPVPADTTHANNTAQRQAPSAAPPVPWRRAAADGEAALHVSRLVESWALVAGVRVVEARQFLLDIASFLELEQEVAEQAAEGCRGGSSSDSSRGAAVEGAPGTAADAGRRRADAPAQPAKQEGQGAAAERAASQRPSSRLSKHVQVQLHPTFGQHTQRGRTMLEFARAVEERVAAVHGGQRSAVPPFLRRICAGRLGPMDWLSQLSREPEVAQEVRLWYDDTRTPQQRAYPELFRLQLAEQQARERGATLRLAGPQHQPLNLGWEECAAAVSGRLLPAPAVGGDT